MDAESGPKRSKATLPSPQVVASRAPANAAAALAQRLYFTGDGKSVSAASVPGSVVVPPLNFAKLRGDGVAGGGGSAATPAVLAPRRPATKKPTRPNVTRAATSRVLYANDAKGRLPVTGSQSARQAGSVGDAVPPVVAWHTESVPSISHSTMEGGHAAMAHGHGYDSDDSEGAEVGSVGGPTLRMGLLHRAQFSKTFIDVLEERNPAFSRLQLKVCEPLSYDVAFSVDVVPLTLYGCTGFIICVS
jgi:hypothetical protein